ncbi:MAG: hypothetical protein ACRDLL_03305 [Solirubrobacterales bacterium]
MTYVDQELAALLDADPGATPSPVPEPDEMGIDEAELSPDDLSSPSETPRPRAQLQALPRRLRPPVWI